MKKALFALAAICVCTSLQALTLTWTTVTELNLLYNTGTGTTGVVGGSFIYSTVENDRNYAGAIAGADGYDKVQSAKVNFPDTQEENKRIESFVLINDPSDKKTSGTYFLIFTGAQADTYYWATIDASDAQDYWYEASGMPGSVEVTFSEYVVPEPTVMALLALGVAGLALKRKHA